MLGLVGRVNRVRPSLAALAPWRDGMPAAANVGVAALMYGDGEPLIFNAGKYCTATLLKGRWAQSDWDGVWDGLD